MRVCITGAQSKIAFEFCGILSRRHVAVEHIEKVPISLGGEVPLDCDLYLLCHGLLRDRKMQDQSEAERRQGWHMNLESHSRIIDRLVRENDRARICVIGSESAYRGSFDDTYAAAKMLLHDYCKRKVLRTPGQQLVVISPGVISDCGMTTRRKDLDRLEARRRAHPMQRFLTAREVAEMAATLLLDQPYISSTVIRMHGGER